MPQSGPSAIIQLVPFLIVFAIMYFMIIKPQKDKQKDHEKKVAGLKKNDEVVTIGGIHGTIINVKERTLIVRIDDDTKVEIDKNAVSRVEKVA